MTVAPNLTFMQTLTVKLIRNDQWQRELSRVDQPYSPLGVKITLPIEMEFISSDFLLQCVCSD